MPESLMKTSVSVKWLHLTETLMNLVENERFAAPTFANVGRTLTPPRAGALVTRRSMLQRWRTHAMQEAPQWFPLCESNALPWIPQINRWFFGPKYREWVDMRARVVCGVTPPPL